MTTTIEITKDMNNGGYEYCNISLPDGNLSFGYEEYNHQGVIAQIAPIGIPPPSAFAIDTISGLIP